jgi:hypothetical protein
MHRTVTQARNAPSQNLGAQVRIPKKSSCESPAMFGLLANSHPTHMRQPDPRAAPVGMRLAVDELIAVDGTFSVGNRPVAGSRAEGKSTKEALRSLKRRLSDVVYGQLVADHRRLHGAASNEVWEDTQGRLEACVAG